MAAENEVMEARLSERPRGCYQGYADGCLNFGFADENCYECPWQDWREGAGLGTV